MANILYFITIFTIRNIISAGIICVYTSYEYYYRTYYLLHISIDVTTKTRNIKYVKVPNIAFCVYVYTRVYQRMKNTAVL